MKSVCLKSAAFALFFVVIGIVLLRPDLGGATPATLPLEVRLASGKTHVLMVEIARSNAEREHGLMGRTSLAPDAGMLFDFGAPRLVTMWMHDTPLPLDMIFADEQGRVVRIAANTTPFSEALISSGVPVLYVVEIAGGRAAEIGIAVGDQLAGKALQPAQSP